VTDESVLRDWRYKAGLQEGWEQGHEAGFDEGYEAGFEDGKASSSSSIVFGSNASATVTSVPLGAATASTLRTKP
jgi:flagellar biosynthesis/type III secretory pathway protein FliH